MKKMLSAKQRESEFVGGRVSMLVCNFKGVIDSLS